MNKRLKISPWRRNEPGFTLQEILIALGISALVTLALGDLIVGGYQKYTITSEQTTQVAHARRIQDTIVRELREAIVSDAGDYPIIKAEQDRLEFYSDSDRDAARERVRYWRDGKKFLRGLTEPTGDPARYRDQDETLRVLGEYLTGTSPLFRYYQNDGTELSFPLDITKIVRIGISIVVDVAPGRLPSSTEVQTTVQLRNIKANLEE